MSITVRGVSRVTSRRSAGAGRAMQPAVGVRPGRATCRNTALPRPAHVRLAVLRVHHQLADERVVLWRHAVAAFDEDFFNEPISLDRDTCAFLTFHHAVHHAIFRDGDHADRDHYQ